MAETNEFYIKIGADVNDAMTKLNQLSSQLSNLASNTQRSSNQISNSMGGVSKSLSSAFSSIGIALTTAGIVTAIAGIGKSAITSAAQLEQIKVSFQVFTGSAIAANVMLSELKSQALKSPLQFQDITKGAQTLMQYGLTARQTTEITRTLGDISMGSADRFQRLALAFGQVNAAGRLMGQEARQMINAGFNPLQAISDKTGESMASLTKRMHDGQISVKEVSDAFIAATSEGGRFFGMADKQSQTLQGQFNKLSESFTFVLADLGNLIADSLKLRDNFGLLGDKLLELQEMFTGENAEAIKNSETIRLLNLAIRGLIIIVENVISTIKDMAKAFEDFVKNDPMLNFMKMLGSEITSLLEKIPYLGDKIKALKASFSAVGGQKEKPLPDLVGDAIPEMEKRLEKLREKANLQILIDRNGYDKTITDIYKLGVQIDKLKANRGKPGDLGFSATPSKGADDEQTKAEKNKIERLKQLNQEAAMRINEIWSFGTEKKLITLQNNYQLEIRDFKKYGVEYNNITKKYEEERAKIIDDAAKTRAASESNYFNDVLNGLISTYERIEKAEIARIKNLFSELQSEVAGIEIAYPKGFDDFVNDFVKSDNESKIKNYSDSLTSSLKDFGVNIFTGFADIAGAALAGVSTFGDAIAQVGSMFLGLIGDLLIQMGTSTIKLGLAAESIQAVLTTIGLPTGGIAAIAVGTLAVAAGSVLKGMAAKTNSAISAKPTGTQVSVKSGTSSGMASGSTYQYGGASYATQTVRLAIDLTGAITATQTGYQINKSLETTLRVTGR